ncbi:act minimal PKS ketosynthase (KS/KS alpha)/minimal PKS ketosynthase (KS/KS alpha) [Nocardia tenerifensis]|uniref:Act minimal PKS ketosynthase (KS/KS alpha)/minimal PKS ketosynthase (KS/KS alpha) n=1 Tax=Nocardia tenerifensis TaxID=228006 RepID=A0A318KH98_9NOCA|nr:beta-ketoacyl-[acyl-carrier-protein] synthase family protein [Nocardia tenerifensis]PXX71553.1 act minimal PKS ketosynthase (KS/KS alpha)/minimal PKS ketosynthase (KS/KS alpha) [Nocardia tenerifensis]
MRAVITGIGVVAPNGQEPEEFWDNVMRGEVRIEDEPLMTALGLRCHGVARVDDFDLADTWSPREADELAGLGRFVQLGATAARKAMEDSGLPAAGADLCGGAAIFASAVGGAPEMQEMYERATVNSLPPILPRRMSPATYDSIFLDYVPGLLAERYGLNGMTTTLTTGCTAGLDALGLAFDLVRNGEAPFVLAGAGESPLNGLSYATLDVIGCLSRAEGPVERASRPFDIGRAGFVISEGAAFVVLEERAHALARGAHIYAEVRGFGSTSNAKHMTDLDSTGASMVRTIDAALADCGVDRAAIDYINAHGSSTPQNDLFETNAFKTVFGPRAYQIPISSLKSMIGHSLSSASLMAVIATLGAIDRQTVPPTANYREPDPECDLDYVVDAARPATVETAMVVASGFGGIHSAAVLERVT